MAYSVIASQEDMAASFMAGGEYYVEGGKLVIDDTNAYGGRFVASEMASSFKNFQPLKIEL